MKVLTLFFTICQEEKTNVLKLQRLRAIKKIITRENTTPIKFSEQRKGQNRQSSSQYLIQKRTKLGYVHIKHVRDINPPVCYPKK